MKSAEPVVTRVLDQADARAAGRHSASIALVDGVRHQLDLL
ncbi:hypothetical protein [Streptomyces sp. NRRL B-1347]|nr:hypothetical protein [Streptomyces sp. NRRL B-1347]